MKNMKLLVFALIAISSLSLAGCGLLKNKGTSGSGDVAPTVTA
jgi:outer membrane murein-binding lipoprotein Lpp